MTFSGSSKSKLELLALAAKSEDDLNIISALSQDGVLKKTNIRWIRKRHRFSILINRFRWELLTNQKQRTVPFGRVQTMLAFDGVLRVSELGADQALENEVLSLLHIEFSAGENFDEITLVCSGSILIKLQVEFIHVILQDLSFINQIKKGTIPNHSFGIE